MSARVFVEVVEDVVRSGPHKRQPMLVEWSAGAWGPWVWAFSVVTIYPNVRRRLSESVYVALIHTDGSAQLLSRDEDECLLFQTLWELEK